MKKIIFSIFCLFIYAEHTLFAITSRNLFYNDVSEDFIIRWAFQDFCDHVYDMTTDKRFWPSSPDGLTFDPKMVKPGDVIFVRNIDSFMTEMHPQIENPYIIITHGEQKETNHSYQRKYFEDEENIISWLSIHPLKEGHSKYYPLPLGVQPRKSRYEDKSMNSFFRELRQNSEKNKLIYLNFNTANQYAERSLVRSLFADKPYCLSNEHNLQFNEYMKQMATCKFALSPRGAGPDCYRTWEALLVGTIPIVRRCVYEHPQNVDNKTPCLHSQLDDLYQGLPVLVIDSWETLTEDYLEQKYKEITSKQYDIAPLYMEYWKNKIAKIKRNFLKSYSSGQKKGPKHGREIKN